MYMYQKILSPVVPSKTTIGLDDKPSCSIVSSIGRIERLRSIVSRVDNTINFPLITA